MATQRLLGDDERDSGIDDLARPRAGWLSAVCCCCFGGGADEDGEASGGVPSPASAGGAARDLRSFLATPFFAGVSSSGTAALRFVFFSALSERRVSAST
jgi:hypothetical protein